MQTFLEGIRHITDLEGYDHMLFILALCAPFTLSEWRKIVLLATAFTIGHSITLALAALKIIFFNRELIELLIPITIMLTCIWNIVGEKWIKQKSNIVRYGLMLGFGLIHGMGFSSYFRMMFNETSDIVKNLFLFNLGVEAGQIIIIAVILVIMFVLISIFRLRKQWVNIGLSGFSFCVAAWLVYGILTEV